MTRGFPPSGITRPHDEQGLPINGRRRNITIALPQRKEMPVAYGTEAHSAARGYVVGDTIGAVLAVRGKTTRERVTVSYYSDRASLSQESR